MHNLLDLPLFRKMTDGNASERAIDFETLDEDGLGDEAEGGHFLEDAVVCGLVEGHSVLGLILDLSLRPLLLLGGFTSRGGSGGFCFGLHIEIIKSAKLEGKVSSR